MSSYGKLKYGLLICTILKLCSGLTEKCVINQEYGFYKYECHNLTDPEFRQFLGDLSQWCQQQQNCDSLKELSFTSSSIDQLPARIFQQFGNLTKLKMEETNITELTDGVFKNLTNLGILDLENNHIASINPSVFRDLPSLTELNLSNNSLSDFTMTEMAEVKIINLNNNKLKSIILKDLEKLGWVEAENNLLKNLDGSFVNLTALTRLELVNNILEHIKGTDFQGLINLKYLYLSHNKIRSIDSNAFHNMKNLLGLALGNNQLIDLPSNLFTNNLDLNVINIQNNKLTDLPKNLFRGLRKLTILDLNNNSLSEIKAETFGIDQRSEENLPAKINTIYLNHNQLQDIDFKIFEYTKTVYLDVLHNKLTVLDLSKLTCNIDASFNNIEEIFDSNKTEQTINNVHRILLDSNRVRNLKSGLFRRFPNLSELSFAHNQIADLPEGVFNHLNELTNLDLSYNLLTACHPKTFFGLYNLAFLILSNNSLETLDVDGILQELPELDTLDIDFNNWRCDYLEKMLSSDIVKNRKDVKFNSGNNQDVDNENSVNGVRCLNATDSG